MNNLTKEELARIFSMYMPCCAEIDGKHTKIVSVCFQHYQDEAKYEYEDVIVETDEDGYETGGRWATTDFEYFENKVPKLKLLPLSKITDEHAIEVANLWNKGWEINKRAQFYLELVNKTTDQIIRIWFTGSIDFQLVVSNETLFDNCGSIVEMIDKFRELGYALPYKGKSLFDLGIAIDKTTL